MEKCMGKCGKNGTKVLEIAGNICKLCDDCYSLHQQGMKIFDEAEKVSAGTLEFTIPGEPMAKQRPRATKSGVVYTPKRTVSYENLIKEMYLSRHEGTVLEGELELIVRAYFKIPASKSMKVKEAMRRGEIRPVKKPDWDNIGKIVADSLNSIAYDDDKQIVRAVVEKYYSDRPRVEVTIRRLGT